MYKCDHSPAEECNALTFTLGEGHGCGDTNGNLRVSPETYVVDIIANND